MTQADFEISELAGAVSDADAARLAELVGQLSSAAPPDRAALQSIVDSPATNLLVARADGELIGCLVLVLFRIPTGLRARIEDVVVSQNHRGQGIGKALNQAAIDRAQTAGARSVDLTSSPSREAANQLYQSLGFKQRDTNVYRYSW